MLVEVCADCVNEYRSICPCCGALRQHCLIHSDEEMPKMGICSDFVMLEV